MCLHCDNTISTVAFTMMDVPSLRVVCQRKTSPSSHCHPFKKTLTMFKSFLSWPQLWRKKKASTLFILQTPVLLPLFMCTLCLLFAETRSATIKPVCLCTAVLIHIATPFSIQGVKKKKREKQIGKYALLQRSKTRQRREDHPLSPLDIGGFKGSSGLCSGVESPEGGNLNQGALCSSLFCSVPVVKRR